MLEYFVDNWADYWYYEKENVISNFKVRGFMWLYIYMRIKSNKNGSTEESNHPKEW